jgi:hypothetical protein
MPGGTRRRRPSKLDRGGRLIPPAWLHANHLKAELFLTLEPSIVRSFEPWPGPDAQVKAQRGFLSERP